MTKAALAQTMRKAGPWQPAGHEDKWHVEQNFKPLTDSCIPAVRMPISNSDKSNWTSQAQPKCLCMRNINVVLSHWAEGVSVKHYWNKLTDETVRQETCGKRLYKPHRYKLTD